MMLHSFIIVYIDVLMIKRKASISGAQLVVEMAGATSTRSPDDTAKRAAIMAEHRQYLLQTIGAGDAGRYGFGATTKAEPDQFLSQRTRTGNEANAKTSYNMPRAPKNAARKKAESAPLKRRTTSTSSQSKNDDLEPASPPDPTDTQPVKGKRKAVDGEAQDDGGNGAGPAAKKTKCKSPKRGKQQDASAEHESAKSTAAQIPPPRPLSLTLAAKIWDVKAFLVDQRGQDSSLLRDASNKALVTLPAIDLHGAIMKMHIDYDTGRLGNTHIAEVETWIARRFHQPVRSMLEQLWVTLNIEDTPVPDLVLEIAEKVGGHGLQNVNLLEVELEMFCVAKQAWLAKENPLPIVPEVLSVQETFDKVMKKVWEAAQQAATVQALSHIRRIERDVGVCPRPTRII
jgi:hypothetical protein